MPVPGLFGIKSFSEIISPFFISLVRTRDLLASLLGICSHSNTVFSPDPQPIPIHREFEIAFLKSSGSPEW